MATELDARASTNGATASFTVSSGSDRILIVALDWGATADDVSAVTYGGQSMVKAAQEDTGIGRGASIWYILDAGIAAASGTTLSPTWVGGTPASGRVYWHAISYEGLNQAGGSSTLIDSAAVGDGDGSPNPMTGLDVTEEDGGVVVATSQTNAQAGGASPTWGSDMTANGEFINASSRSNTFATRISTTDGNVDVECTWVTAAQRADVTAAFAPAAAGGTAHDETITDSVGITDTQVEAVGDNVVDEVGISDTLDVELAAVRTITDSVGITDSTIAAMGLTVTIADSVGITDTTIAAKGLTFSITDSIGISDQLVRAVAKTRTLIDSAGITDVTVGGQAHGQTLIDTVGIADSIATQSAGADSATVIDDVAVTDQMASALAAARTVADDVGMTDAVVVVVAKTRDLVDVVGVSDTLDRALALNRTIVDAVGIADAIAFSSAGAGEEVPTDDVGIVDLVDRDLALGRTFGPDDVGIADTVAAALAADRGLAESVGITDVMVHQLESADAEIHLEAIGITDVLVVEVAKVRTVIDSIGSMDPMVRAAAFARQVDDALGITDTATGSTSAAGAAGYGYDTAGAARRWGTRGAERRWGIVATRRTTRP